MSKSNLILYQRLKIVKSLGGGGGVCMCIVLSCSNAAWQYFSTGAFGSTARCQECIALSFALCVLTAKGFRLRAFMKDCFLTELGARQYSHSCISYSRPRSYIPVTFCGSVPSWTLQSWGHWWCFCFYGKLKKPADALKFRCPLNISSRGWMDTFFSHR